jgi:hypothetical protein
MTSIATDKSASADSFVPILKGAVGLSLAAIALYGSLAPLLGYAVDSPVHWIVAFVGGLVGGFLARGR